MAAPRKYPEELGERAIRLAGRRGWNDHHANVGTATTARMIFQIRMEPGHDFAEECEFEGAQNLVDDNPTRGRAQPERAARGSATGGRGNP